jgi:hypothetical protein
LNIELLSGALKSIFISSILELKNSKLAKLW